MNRGLVVDLVVLGLLLFAVVRGWRNGSVREMLGFLALACGMALAPALVGPVAALIGAFSGWDVNLARLAALCLVVTVAAAGLIWWGRRRLGDAQISGPRWLDRLGGIVVGIFRAVVVAALFLYAMLAISASEPHLPGFTEGVVASASGDVLADPESPVTGLLDAIVARSDDMRALTLWVRQQTSLGLTTGADRVFFSAAPAVERDPDAERELFELLNEAREKQGLLRLEWCEECAEVARDHARDMYVEGYFSHVTLEGLDPFERLVRAGVPYEAAGENLSMAPSPREAHEGLLASPDHAANILRPVFDEAGIGIYRGPYGLLCTQVFRAAPREGSALSRDGGSSPS
jgi:uncharacterized protein YkwD/uncharacterized membrane protein required for colicin V production